MNQKTGILVVSFGTSHSTTRARTIQATQQEIQAIINGDPQKSSISLGGGKVHGRTLVDMTTGLLAGETVEKDQFMPITVIDKTNAQEYYDEMFGK